MIPQIEAPVPYSDSPGCIFPELGRSLNKNDVGKRILRTYPCGKDKSFMRMRRSSKETWLLVALCADSLTIQSFEEVNGAKTHPYVRPLIWLNAKYLDNNWLTTEEAEVLFMNAKTPYERARGIAIGELRKLHL